MSTLGKQLVIIVWGFILGDVLAYIASQLETATPDYLVAGVLGVVVALLAGNCIGWISQSANPEK